jgi:hypothetical protein
MEEQLVNGHRRLSYSLDNRTLVPMEVQRRKGKGGDQRQFLR